MTFQVTYFYQFFKNLFDRNEDCFLNILEAAKKNPLLYGNKMVNILLGELTRIHNVIHRFVILYQFIELLLDVTTTRYIEDQYREFKENAITNNDFVHNFGEITKGRSRVNDILRKARLNRLRKANALPKRARHYSILSSIQ